MRIHASSSESGFGSRGYNNEFALYFDDVEEEGRKWVRVALKVDVVGYGYHNDSEETYLVSFMCSVHEEPAGRVVRAHHCQGASWRLFRDAEDMWTPPTSQSGQRNARDLIPPVLLMVVRADKSVALDLEKLWRVDVKTMLWYVLHVKHHLPKDLVKLIFQLSCDSKERFYPAWPDDYNIKSAIDAFDNLADVEAKKEDPKEEKPDPPKSGKKI